MACTMACTAASNSLAAERRSSALTYGGSCMEATLPKTRQSGAAEAAVASLATIAVTAIAKEGINFVANWLKELEEDLKGVDQASYFGPLYCNLETETDTDAGKTTSFVSKLGVSPEIIYTRKKIKGGAVAELPEIELTTNVEIAVTSRKPIGGLLLLRPAKLIFNESIAARGKNKDVVVTYEVEYFGERDGKKKSVAKKFTSEPYLIEDVKEGETINLLAHKSDVVLFELPSAAVAYPKFTCKSQAAGNCANNEDSAGSGAPFKLTVTLSETEAGDGYKLVAAIAKSAGEGLADKSDDLIKEIVEAIVGKPDGDGSADSKDAS